MERQAVFDLIARCTGEVVTELEGAALTGDESFEELGANSVDRAEIVALVLESLELNMPRVEAFGPRTLGGLADLLHDKLAAS